MLESCLYQTLYTRLCIPDSVYQTLYAHADLIMYYGIHSIRQGILYILLAPRY